MRDYFLIFVFICCMLIPFVGCGDTQKEVSNKQSYDMTPQEFFDYKIRKSEVTDSAGHMYYLYEVGARDWRNYAFDLEHRMDCKVCLDIFD